MPLFIPSFHFVNPDEKLKPEWCQLVINYHYYNSNNRNLLAGKNVKEIDEYAAGDFDMTPFKKQFTSMRKKLANAQKNPDGSMGQWAQDINTIGVEFTPLALIPIKLNSAITNIMKIPVDPIVVAQDSLAMKKKEEDIQFLKDKPVIEADLQDIADRLGVGAVDIGTTKHSSTKFSEAPMGLDLDNPMHQEIFSQLFYSLKVQTAFEKVLKQMHNIKGSDEVRRLVVEDHFKYGVGVNRSWQSPITGLPDHEYVYPGSVRTPWSMLQDFSDNTHRIFDMEVTVMEMFNYFSNEISGEEELSQILNGDTGYCKCNKNFAPVTIQRANWDSYRIQLKYIEVRTVDWIGVKTKEPSKRGVNTFTNNPDESKSKMWGQNTIGFYWLPNTQYFFQIQRLPGTYRKKGQEAYQNFSSYIFRSQKKSAVELSIAENKKAQIAEIKLQHTLIKSKPPGSYVDIRFMRKALEGLVEDNNKYTMDDLLSLFFEHNIMLGDTEDFDGKNDGQVKPFIDVPGGLKDEARGYMTVIAAASYNIASITGINEQLTGQTAEELVGLQQLKINSGLTSIDYCNQAIKYQWECLNNSWVLLIQAAIEKGGKTRQAIVDMIGEADTELLDSLNEAALHELTAKVEVGNTFAQMQSIQMYVELLKQKGVWSAVDEYMLSAIDNPKEKMKMLYFIEERYKAEQERIRAEQMAQAQTLEQQRGQNDLQVKQAEGQQKQQEITTKGNVEAQLLTLANQLGIKASTVQGMIDKALKKEMAQGQTQKSLTVNQQKANLENQKAYA